MNQREYYLRHLPHYQPRNAMFHVVFRLEGSLPASCVVKLRREREEEQENIWGYSDLHRRAEEWRAIQENYFDRFDTLIDSSMTGPRWLERPDVSAIVAEAIHYRDVKMYDLYAYTIMPNHVHLVINTVGRPDWSTYNLTSIIDKLKWNTALKCNKLLHRTGQFWQHESYDHVIRNGEELERTIWYILSNPVNAKLVKEWTDWPFTYVKPEFFRSD